MSDRFVLIFAICLLGAVLVDAIFNGGAVVFFLLLKLTDFVEYLAFWR